MMHKDKIEDCVKECDKTFGCRSVGFHWDLVNMAFTAETNVTDEDLANWYNCVLYKHPCDQFLVDKFDRGSYHFSKLGKI